MVFHSFAMWLARDIGISSCGRHDNRMDKMWWNKQWMDWLFEPEYADSYNVDNAYWLKGEFLLIVGEINTNINVASIRPIAKIDRDSRIAHAEIPEKSRRGGIDLYFEGDSIIHRWIRSQCLPAMSSLLSLTRISVLGWKILSLSLRPVARTLIIAKNTL
jgi:hypothetical protein